MARPITERPRIFHNHSDAQIADEWGLLNARIKKVAERLEELRPSSSAAISTLLKAKPSSS